MRDLTRIRTEIDNIQKQWNKEIQDNKTRTAEVEEKLNRFMDELSTVETPEDYTRVNAEIVDMKARLAFYEMQRENFTHHLNSMTYKTFKDEIMESYRKMVVSYQKKLLKSYTDYLHLCNEYMMAANSALETMYLINAFAKRDRLENTQAIRPWANIASITDSKEVAFRDFCQYYDKTPSRFYLMELAVKANGQNK